MPVYSWRYQNSRIPLEQLAVNIQYWAQSGGYTGKLKKKKNESVLVIDRGPGSWTGKAKLSFSGNQQLFTVQIDTGKSPFQNAAKSLPKVIKHYTNADVYVPHAHHHAPAPPPAPQPQPLPEPQPRYEPQVQPTYEEPEPEPTVAAPPTEERYEEHAPACPTCGGDARYIEQYGRWYCYNCQTYLPHEEPEPEPLEEPVPHEAMHETHVPACPICSGDSKYIEQYNRWYCYNCQAYVPQESVEHEHEVEPETEFQELPTEPEPSPEYHTPVCPTCNHEARFIQQYDRWYCYNCQKYL